MISNLVLHLEIAASQSINSYVAALTVRGRTLRSWADASTVRPNSATPYGLRPRIEAGWPGSFSVLPVLTTLVPSTFRIDTSLSRKLPT